MTKVTEITNCRIGGSANLLTVLDLGIQHLTGVFPKTPDAEVTAGPLRLAWCPESGLLQLRHSYDLKEMYGMNYGYRSGLNASMVRHLSRKIELLTRRFGIAAGDCVLDIGSNDATTLKAYPVAGIRRIGIDPTGCKFAQYYTDGIELVPDFFDAAAFGAVANGAKAKIVTSIAMFYDLENPASFVRDVAAVLHSDGVWHFEQSYMPTMLRMNAYDTVCHEHLEYYSLGVVRRLLSAAGLRIVDVEMNAVNGGSFAVTAVHEHSRIKSNHAVIDWLLGQEERMGLETPRPYRRFEERVFEHRKNLVDLIRRLNADGKRVFGYGASTKGNVLLQFCGFGPKDIPCIADVNPDKDGAFTPGTGIPIVSESRAREMRPDYFLVLPWHFRDGILSREEAFRASGGKFIFPLPEIEII
jgi:hypothetical protein